MKKVVLKKKPNKGPKPRRDILSRLRSTTIGDLGEMLIEAGGAARRFLNVEAKRFDYAPAAFNIPAAGGGVSFTTGVALGDDYNQRDGHSIRSKSYEARFVCKLNAAAVSDAVRFVLFADLEGQGVQPTPAQLLESTAAANGFVSPFQHDNVRRFQVIHDELLHLTAVTVRQERVLKIPLDGHLHWSAATGAIADAKEGQIFFLFIAAEQANLTEVTWYSRLSYVDN